jgi:pyruvate kinase
MARSLEGRSETADLADLLEQLKALRAESLQRADVRLQRFADCFTDGRFSPSATNLAHYLSLRQHDLRPLQERLAGLGLSSLGRGEAHILDNLDSVITLLSRLVGGSTTAAPDPEVMVSMTEGLRILESHTEQLFGPSPTGRSVRIMVTLPEAAARDYALVEALVATGMDCARINCAHDEEGAWTCMIDHVRRAVRATGHVCRVLMDIGGPKIRTGPIAPGPPIHHLKVEYDTYGQPLRPALVLLTSQAGAPPSGLPADFQLRIPSEVYEHLAPGDRLLFIDNRGKTRHLLITTRESDRGTLAECSRGAYLRAGSSVAWQRRADDGAYCTVQSFPLEQFPGAPLPIRLFRDDGLLLTADSALGQPALRNELGAVIKPAEISCTHPDVVKALRCGQSVWIDDGKLGAVVESVSEQGAMLRIKHAAPRGVVVRADKGLNFPETELALPALGDKDLQDLDFICAHADMVGFSFVQSHEDMQQLLCQLRLRGAEGLPVIAKIETAKAVRNLPEIILGAIGQTLLGIMIARGDLAVELGSVRLAEIQEEILWLCEAAHVPVIWATEVLETMAKRGVRARAELTDAAMGVRAECVMLNKGPYILDALRLLDSILSRMQAHQHKKSSLLRALHW